MNEKQLYAVYGPSAEYGDGQGILGVFRRKADAESLIRSLKEIDIEQAIEILTETEDYLPATLSLDERRRVHAARRRVLAGRGISWNTAALVLGWPWYVQEYFIREVTEVDTDYSDLVGWLDEE